MERASGILMPVASLPSKYGIGAFSQSAYDFVDFLAEAGQRYWQILPLGPTGYGDSPYQSFSTFAGNPYFIDLERLAAEGLLTEEECESFDFGKNPEQIDYEKMYRNRFEALRLAFGRSSYGSEKRYQEFLEKNRLWLDDYCLFMAVKNHFHGSSWNTWDEDIRFRKGEALEKYSFLLKDEVGFFRFQQYEFQKQWFDLKTYANGRGVKIIGDIPIYVAFDSADTWAAPGLFQFDEKGQPTGVAGCPPDGFSATGQVWGNPLYDWEHHKREDYSWWMQRMEHCFKLYDVVRVDHFRGFDEYFFVPYGADTAAGGHWVKGPGIELFRTMKEKLGELPIIAEDLGFLTDTVIKLVEDSGFPGMKVLEFAFDSREKSNYLPYTYTRNCVAYTGTHDNQTIKGWFDTLPPEDYEHLKAYLHLSKDDEREIAWKMIRVVFESVADTAIIPMQDFLELGDEARINVPSRLGGNWCWRMRPDVLTEELKEKIRSFTKLYGRCS